MLRFRAELRAPGCMHIILEAVSPRAPYLLENRSGQGLRYRQVGIADLPYLPLPPYSAAGFAWQQDPSSEGIPSVRLIAKEPCRDLPACRTVTSCQILRAHIVQNAYKLHAPWLWGNLREHLCPVVV